MHSSSIVFLINHGQNQYKLSNEAVNTSSSILLQNLISITEGASIDIPIHTPDSLPSPKNIIVFFSGEEKISQVDLIDEVRVAAYFICDDYLSEICSRIRLLFQDKTREAEQEAIYAKYLSLPELLAYEVSFYIPLYLVTNSIKKCNYVFIQKWAKKNEGIFCFSVTREEVHGRSITTLIEKETKDKIFTRYSWYTDIYPICPFIEVEMLDNSYHGVFYQYYLNGVLAKQAHYYRDKLHGHLYRWYKNGILLESSYYNMGREEGNSKTWYPDGTLKESKYIIDGLWKGPSLYYYPDGNLSQEYHYVDGLEEGICTKYYPFGTLAEEAIYKKGALHGTLRRWHENGLIALSGSYFQGEKYGTFTYYSSTVANLVIRTEEYGKYNVISSYVFNLLHYISRAFAYLF